MRHMVLLTLVCVAVHTCWPQELVGQVAVWKAGQKDFPQPAKPTPVDSNQEEKLHTITLSPMSEPVPALKYRFWKTPAVRQPGNVNDAMSRAVIFFLSHPNRDTLDRQYDVSAEQWLESKTVHADEKAYLADQQEVLRAIYRAAELDTIQPRSIVRDLKGRAALGADLTEIQTLRNLARIVQLDAHAAIFEQRFDNAVQAISAGFRLAEYAQKSGDASLVSSLVSVAISGLTFEMVDQLSQQSDAPNLYWALASLPDEFWSMRGAVEGESQFIARVLYPLLEPFTPGLQESDWEARLLEAIEVIILSDASPFDSGPVRADEKAPEQMTRLVAGAIIFAFSDRAMQELVDAGTSSEQVQKMRATEAVARAVQLRFEQGRDDLFKWAMLGPAAKSYSSREWQRFSQRHGTSEFILPANVLLGLVIPAIQAAESAGLRADTQHKQLLLREALRAHAATHDGKLPDSLVKLQPVPTLPNPTTGQLFEYEKVSDTEAIIRRPAFHPDDQNVIRIKLQAAPKN